MPSKKGWFGCSKRRQTQDNQIIVALDMKNQTLTCGFTNDNDNEVDFLL
jgi:hypothetical protein